MIKLVIFDMDGVLIDSESVYQKPLKELREAFGIHLTTEQWRRAIGANRKVTAEIIKEAMGQDYDCQPFFDAADELTYGWLDNNVMQIKKGIVELIDYLKANNYKIAVGSSSSEKRIAKSLKPNGLYDRFDLVFSGAGLNKSKPDPYIYNLLMEKMGYKPEETIIIEDSNQGLKAAIASGAYAIHIPDITEVDEDVKNAAYATIDDASVLIDLLKENKIK